MNLAEHVTVVLAEYARRGYCFEDSWTYAMRSLPKGKNPIEKAHLADWKPVLRWAKPFYEASFITRWPELEQPSQQEDQSDNRDSDAQEVERVAVPLLS